MSSLLYVRLKGTCSLASRVRQAPMNKIINLYVNYFKIPKKHRGPHKTPWRAACLRTLGLKVKEKYIYRTIKGPLLRNVDCFFTVVSEVTTGSKIT